MMTSADWLELVKGLALWVGGAAGLLILGGWLYGRAAYDAWGEDNVDKRVFWGGVIAGIGLCWFLCAPAVLFFQRSVP